MEKKILNIEDLKIKIVPRESLSYEPLLSNKRVHFLVDNYLNKNINLFKHWILPIARAINHKKFVIVCELVKLASVYEPNEVIFTNYILKFTLYAKKSRHSICIGRLVDNDIKNYKSFIHVNYSEIDVYSTSVIPVNVTFNNAISNFFVLNCSFLNNKIPQNTRKTLKILGLLDFHCKATNFVKLLKDASIPDKFSYFYYNYDIGKEIKFSISYDIQDEKPKNNYRVNETSTNTIILSKSDVERQIIKLFIDNNFIFTHDWCKDDLSKISLIEIISLLKLMSY